MKLALIGRNISHSRSPFIYRYLLGSSIEYDLIDVDEVEKLPSLKDLFQNYKGINITTPYKTNYFTQIETSSEIFSIGAINCLKKTDRAILGTNTDYLALKEMFTLRHLKDHFIILGNGVMARICLQLAYELGISFYHLHRGNGLTSDYSFHELIHLEKKTIIINCCSRDFIYEGAGSKKAEFWDLNYALTPHLTHLPFLFNSYTDGQELLWKQAQMAISFWLGKNCSPKY